MPRKSSGKEAEMPDSLKVLVIVVVPVVLLMVILKLTGC